MGSYLIVKEALRRLGASKIIFGSEFPLYHPQVELEKIRVLLKGEDFERVTSKNILAMLPELASFDAIFFAGFRPILLSWRQQRLSSHPRPDGDSGGDEVFGREASRCGFHSERDPPSGSPNDG